MQLVPLWILLGLILTVEPALAVVPAVRVFVPYNIHTGVSTTTQIDEDSKYVTVESVQLVNPSRFFAQTYLRSDFHLLVDDHVYTAVANKQEPALGPNETNILGAGAQELLYVTFKVPLDVTSGKFEFTPHWNGDGGGTVDYCCLYY
jgi:hypothetical protein